MNHGSQHLLGCTSIKKKAVLFITSKTAAHKYNKGDIPFVQQR